MIWGAFDFNLSTMALPGTKVVVHKNSEIMDHGRSMAQRDGGLFPTYNGIKATKYICPRHMWNGSRIK